MFEYELSLEGPVSFCVICCDKLTGGKEVPCCGANVCHNCFYSRYRKSGTTAAADSRITCPICQKQVTWVAQSSALNFTPQFHNWSLLPGSAKAHGKKSPFDNTSAATLVKDSDDKVGRKPFLFLFQRNRVAAMQQPTKKS
ncbi:hypothetical protein HDU81_000137 [Chytriomyces hyalinus]|nr:hypothetical protein HDU81_000137 [Chytriomyces hyalinus]